MLVPVKDASRRCRGGLQAILDRRCARWLAARQVGTGGWPTRSNKGMALGCLDNPEYAPQPTQKPRQFHFKRLTNHASVDHGQRHAGIVDLERLAGSEGIRRALGEKDRISTRELINSLLADDEYDWAAANKGRPINEAWLRERLRNVITPDAKGKPGSERWVRVPKKSEATAGVVSRMPGRDLYPSLDTQNHPADPATDDNSLKDKDNRRQMRVRALGDGMMSIWRPTSIRRPEIERVRRRMMIRRQMQRDPSADATRCIRRRITKQKQSLRRRRRMRRMIWGC